MELPVERVLTPLEQFSNSQATTGAALLLAVAVALFLANSDYRDIYLSLNHLPFGLHLGDWSISMSLHHWVNEGLMVFFFFILGLEIKREILVGDLRDIRKSMLVLCMALGGMVTPAAVYLLFQSGGGPAVAGWGIPMATDTAFALGILGLLNSRAPASATLLLSALAIVDDLGAVLVISVFYSNELDVNALLAAAGALGLLALLNVAGFRRPALYLAAGVALWWFTLQSGVHATTAGILAAMAVPARPYARTRWFRRRMSLLLQRFSEVDSDEQSILENPEQYALADTARQVAQQVTTPLQRWEDRLDKPVSLAVLPLFAFLNAGVVMPSAPADLLQSPVAAGIATGLVLGKTLGVCLFAWVGLRCGLCRLPADMRFIHIVGLGILAGIGFTMSLFIAALAFETQPGLLVEAKLGILSGSFVAGIVGFAVLWCNPVDGQARAQSSRSA